MTDRRRPGPLVAPLVGLAVGLACAALLAPREPVPLLLEARWLAAYALFVGLPGWLLIRLILPPGGGWTLERGLLALASGYSIAVLLGLTLHALFRPIAPWQIAAGGGLVVAVLAAANVRGMAVTPPRGGDGLLPRWPAGLLPVLLLLLLAGALRLADLGWSEFQGDEARVVLRAMAALQGADGALAAHRKVPGEILLAYLFAGSLGQIVESVARLPYAISGVGAVLAFYALARSLLGGPAGLAAGLLLAVNGYFVAFGRILQYDSLAFFLGIAGLLCCWRFGRTASEGATSEGATSEDATGEDATPEDGSPVVWAALASLLVASAALVALGAIFLVLPALTLAWPGLRRHFWPIWPLWPTLRRWPARSWAVLVAWCWPVLPALLAAILVLGASGPAEGPSGVMSYLGPRFGGDHPYWNWALLLQSANHYLSTPYLLVMLGGGVVAVVVGVLASFRVADTRGVVLRLVPALGLAVLTWDRPRAAVALAGVLAVVLAFQAARRVPGLMDNAPGSARPGLGMQVALAWAAGPLVVHGLLIRVPGTHWREAFPGLILVLVALLAPVLAGGATRAARWMQATCYAVVGLLVVGGAHYAWVTLIQHQPEYQQTYPANRHPLDWTDRDGRGIGGVFGVVHRHGWKALGVLSRDGVLAGQFVTNESPAIAAWYLRRPQGCEGAIEYIFRVDRAPHDRNLALPVPLPSGYVTRGRIREDGRSTISIQLAPTDPQRYGDIPAASYEARFDRELASAWGPVGQLYRADLGLAQSRRDCPPRNQSP
ncbi:MAG: glycosyltransferase family 39 protein [Chloroflexi bacterium]|nr:glycosyltransferase family 39 protein [Chloroflexota bacterium]